METQKEFDQTQYLKTQLKYLGFGEDEKLHKDLEKGINSKKKEFEVKTTSDKTLPGNKAEFTLNYNKTEKGGIFLNSYDANLTNEKGESVSQNFRVSRDESFTAKEAINLLEGRSVKIEFDNPKTNEREPAFVKLNFMRIVMKSDCVFCEFPAGKVYFLFAVVIAFYKIPNHSSRYKSSQAVRIGFRIIFIKAERRKLVVEAGVPANLASLFAG